MAGSEGATEASLDIGAILDRALETAEPKGRRPTKTQQLREQRAKITALRAKGFTLVAIAEMVGASKDTLRQALRTPTKTKKKMAAHAARPRTGQGTTEAPSGDGTTVAPKVVLPGRKRKFPSGDDL
jgi:lambda repressor-like predicted transcriptional regulator